MKKSELRKAFLHKRMSLEMSEMQTMTKRISMHLNALLEAYPAKVLHIFLTQEHKKEVDTWQLISSIRKEFPGVKMAAPFVIPGTREMLHFALGHKTTFVPNAWGIPEPNPADSVQIKPDDIDVVIVPLLSFDEKGYRVGYGGGFYDRFLAVCRPEVFKIGISFFGPVERIDDVDVFDIPLDACITPDQVFYWKKT